MYPHQVGRYRVDAVVAGQYDGQEIVVDHPVCDGDVFEGMKVGDRVEVTVVVTDSCPDCTSYPTDLTNIQTPHTYYVADDAIRLLDS